jgi:hypothetical protein
MARRGKKDLYVDIDEEAIEESVDEVMETIEMKGGPDRMTKDEYIVFLHMLSEKIEANLLAAKEEIGD